MEVSSFAALVPFSDMGNSKSLVGDRCGNSDAVTGYKGNDFTYTRLTECLLFARKSILSA